MLRRRNIQELLLLSDGDGGYLSGYQERVRGDRADQGVRPTRFVKLHSYR